MKLERKSMQITHNKKVTFNKREDKVFNLNGFNFIKYGRFRPQRMLSKDMFLQQSTIAFTGSGLFWKLKTNSTIPKDKAVVIVNKAALTAAGTICISKIKWVVDHGASFIEALTNKGFVKRYGHIIPDVTDRTIGFIKQSNSGIANVDTIKDRIVNHISTADNSPLKISTFIKGPASHKKHPITAKTLEEFGITTLAECFALSAITKKWSMTYIKLIS